MDFCFLSWGCRCDDEDEELLIGEADRLLVRRGLVLTGMGAVGVGTILDLDAGGSLLVTELLGILLLVLFSGEEVRMRSMDADLDFREGPSMVGGFSVFLVEVGEDVLMESAWGGTMRGISVDDVLRCLNFSLAKAVAIGVTGDAITDLLAGARGICEL